MGLCQDAILSGYIIDGQQHSAHGPSLAELEIFRKLQRKEQMAHFDGTNIPLAKNKTYTGLPQQVDWAEYITGSVFADQAGELQVQQCMDLPVNTQKLDLQEWAAEGHWDIVTKIPVGPKESQPFQIFGLAPYWRLVYKNGGSDQKEFRLDARAFERGRI